jgi:hypothetical protein
MPSTSLPFLSLPLLTGACSAHPSRSDSQLRSYSHTSKDTCTNAALSEERARTHALTAPYPGLGQLIPLFQAPSFFPHVSIFPDAQASPCKKIISRLWIAPCTSVPATRSSDPSMPAPDICTTHPATALPEPRTPLHSHARRFSSSYTTFLPRKRARTDGRRIQHRLRV